MSFLLKIVQGPNAGAEIALAEGTTVSFGSGDGCDIILSDAALDAVAFELEVASERVMMLFPDGKQSRMELFHVRTVGTTALVVGPSEGPWKELVREKVETADAELADIADNNTGSAGEREAVHGGSQEKSKKGFLSKLFCLIIILLLLLLAGGAAAWLFFPQKVSSLTGGKSDKAAEICLPYWNRTCAFVSGLFRSKENAKTGKQALERVETLADIAGEYNLQTNETASGVLHVKGDFATRIDRLRATARIYRVHPGAELDFADSESLKVAIENLLSLVTENKMRLVSLDGRTAKLSGVVASASDLRCTLEALSRDVPKLVRADCSGVSVGGILPAVEKNEVSENLKSAAGMKTMKTEFSASPSMPVVGILATPYPCLVLKNGSRIMEGARCGDWTVTAIRADSVELSGPAGKTIWRP